MGKNLDDTLSDDDFFRFQRTQSGVARQAMRDHARERAKNRPTELRAALANTIKQAAQLDRENNKDALPALHERIRTLREAIKRADIEHGQL